MLVLTRRKKESIVIGQGILVKVLEIRGSTVRLGIEAPQHVSVRRQELPPRLAVAGSKPAP